MATIHTTLGEHWETFINNEIASGRYASASDVIQDALSGLEERRYKLATLRTHLREGAVQAEQGKVETQSLAEMLTEFRNNA